MRPRPARWLELALFGLILAAAAFLRFNALERPSYWLDEILGDQLTVKAAHGPWWQWIAGMEREHGPLYYATQLLGHGRVPAALFGLATVVLVYAIARLAAGPLAAMAAAIVLAVSPLAVDYSREARPYALLMLLTAALIYAMLRERVWLAAAVMLAMLYASAVSAPVLAAFLCSAVAVSLLSSGERPRARRTPEIVALVALLLIPLLYRGPAAPMTGAARLDAHLLTTIVRALTVSALGNAGHVATTIALMALAVLGAYTLVRRDRRAAVLLTGMTLLPILAAVASLAAMNHWFAVRYITPALIGFIVLAGIGLGRLQWAAIPLALLVAGDTWSAARREPFEKLDWRAIGAVLEQHVRPGDTIVTAEPWSSVSLRYYLRHLPPRVRLAEVNNVTVAEMLTFTSPVWYVSAGGTDAPIRDWMCRTPLLLGGRLENFRLHYAPWATRFVRDRATIDDLRAIAAALGPRVDLRAGRDDEPLLGDGWAGSEGGPGEEFRWAASTEASLIVPRVAPRARRVIVHALPFRQQSMRVSVNGTTIGEVAMQPAWLDYAFEAPATVWREGRNAVAFHFAQAARPADFGGTDRRTLAAAFTRIVVEDVGGTAPTPLRPFVPLRFASDALLDVRAVRGGRDTRWPPETLNRDAVTQLLGRLGYDPAATWPRIERGELRLEDVAATLAWESGCEDDRAFLDRAFAVIAARNPNPGELRDLLGRMRRGMSRPEVVARILRTMDVRERLTAR